MAFTTLWCTFCSSTSSNSVLSTTDLGPQSPMFSVRMRPSRFLSFVPNRCLTRLLSGLRVLASWTLSSVDFYIGNSQQQTLLIPERGMKIRLRVVRLYFSDDAVRCHIVLPWCLLRPASNRA